MPNLITHYYFAETVKEKLGANARKIIDRYPDAYKLGAMGPDFMFAFRELKLKERRLPHIMQYLKMYEVFNLSGEYIRDNQDNIVFSYILGLLCHYVSDFTIHPYVNFFVERHTAKLLPANQIANIHTLIESAIDSHICDEMYNTPSNEFASEKVAQASKKERMAISKFYAKVIGGIFGVKARARRYNFAFVATKLFMKFSVDKSGKKKRFFDKLENIMGGRKLLSGLIHPPEGYKILDYMNNNRVSWLTVRNGKDYSNETVYELLERARDTAVVYVDTYIDYVLKERALSKTEFAINYEGIKIY